MHPAARSRVVALAGGEHVAEDAIAVVEAAERAFAGSSWRQVVALEAALTRCRPEFSVGLVGAFKGLRAARRTYRRTSALGRQANGYRAAVAGWLDQAGGFDIYASTEAVMALHGGPRALDALAAKWADDHPELAAWAREVAAILRAQPDVTVPRISGPETIGVTPEFDIFPSARPPPLRPRSVQRETDAEPENDPPSG